MTNKAKNKKIIKRFLFYYIIYYKFLDIKTLLNIRINLNKEKSLDKDINYNKLNINI